MNSLLQDLRYGARMLMKKPGFTLIAVLTLALGIGANTAIFSVVNAVLLRPLAFNEPDRLARLYEENHGHNFFRQSVSAPNFQDWKNQSQFFEHLAAYYNQSWNLTGFDEPERVSLASVSADFFKALKVEPVMGRTFLPEECKPGGPRLVVLSYGFWQRRFGADPNILGKTLALDSYSFTIIGVMSREAQWPAEAQFWTPLRLDFATTGRRGQFLQVIGRLKPGVSWPQARAEMGTIAERLAREYPGQNSGWSVAVVPVTELIVGSIRPALLTLLGAVGFVLLIVCANLANLLLARNASREREVAIRAALGASRWRLIRQHLTESALLAVAGGAMALLLAVWATETLVALSVGIPRVEEIGIDRRALGFTLAISLLTGLVFGLLPALQISKPNLNESLKEGGRGSSGFSRHRLRSLLVISEVALSLMLLVGAGLMIKSFRHLRAVDPGFDPERVLSMRLSLSRARYTQPALQAAFSEQLIRGLAAMPGVESVAAIAIRPFTDGYWSNSFAIEGRPPLPAGQFIAADNNRATPDYFRTMSIPLRKGRAFTDRDSAQSSPVVIISETMARRFWPNEDPIDQRLTVPDGGPNPRQIVGIVGDIKHDGLEAIVIRPAMYTPFAQSPQSPAQSLTLLVRATGDAASLTGAVRSRVRELDKDMPIDNIVTLSQLVSDSVAQERFSTLLLSIFAAVALLLALVGIYGVMSYAVEQRAHEIGIRLALGAQISDVLRLVVGHGMMLAGAGVGIGVAAALVMAKLISGFSGLLYGVKATDPSTFAVISLLLLAVALMACLIPARRATKVDPMAALRAE
jgi:putative ABC transport system permease protein